MSKEEIEIYQRLMKERSSKGGRKAWKGKSKKEKAAIMSERQKKRWARVKAEKESQTAEPRAGADPERCTD
jgi:hypothetical protein